MSITNSAKDFEKVSSLTTLPRYIADSVALAGRFAKNVVVKPGINTTRFLGRAAQKLTRPAANGVIKGIETTGKQLYYHPKSTVTALGVGGILTRKAMTDASTYTRHVDPNQHATKATTPRITTWGQTIVSPVPIKSIAYQNDDYRKRFDTTYNLY